jgi:acyl-coenzyme A thioesterase PaaI-like protein
MMMVVFSYLGTDADTVRHEMPGFVQEEIDIEAKVLRAGKTVGVAVVELKKKYGKIIAQARYSKYLGVASSKL